MGNINKGKIAGISGNTARVVPSDASGKPTAKITIPWHLRGGTGNLSKGTEVVYVEFDDATGLLLGRADGNWGAYLPDLTADSLTSDDISTKTIGAGIVSAETVSSKKVSGNSVTAGSVTANGDVSAGGISLKTHKHGGVEAGGSKTTGPE